MNHIPISQKTNYRIASIFIENEWVRAKARKIDLENEIDLCLRFDKIARALRETYKFAGISSNNIFWEITPEPVSIITVPAINERSYITVINPEILALQGRTYVNIESCGSVPDNNSYIVERKPFVLIGGYDLEKKYIELAYGDKDFRVKEGPALALYHPQAWIIQHELDHLEGVTIIDKGTVFDSSQLIK